MLSRTAVFGGRWALRAVSVANGEVLLAYEIRLRLVPGCYMIGRVLISGYGGGYSAPAVAIAAL